MTLEQQEELIRKITHKFKAIFSPIGALDETAVNDLIEQYLIDHPDTVMTDTEVNTLIEAYVLANPPAGGDEYFTVNPRAVVVQDSSFTEADVQTMIDTYMTAVVAQPQGVTAVYNWNETMPSIRGPIALDVNATLSVSTSCKNIAYAEKINKVIASVYDSASNIRVLNGDTMVEEHSITLPGIPVSSNLFYIDITPDGKRLVVLYNNSIYTYDIDVATFTPTLINSFTFAGTSSVSIDGTGGTLVIGKQQAPRTIYVYKLNNQGVWVEDHNFLAIHGADSPSAIQYATITKDGLDIFMVTSKAATPARLSRATALDGVFTTPVDVKEITELGEYSGTLGLAVSLDKQTVYISDTRESTISSNNGAVGVYYYDQTDTLVHSQTMRPTDTNANHSFGTGVRCDFMNSKLYVGTQVKHIYKYDIEEAVVALELLLNADLDNDGATTNGWVLGANVFMPSASMLEVQGDYTNAGSLDTTSTRSVLSQDITLDTGEHDLAIDLESYFVNASYDNAEARFYYQLVYGDGTEYFFGIFNSLGINNIQESAVPSTVQLVMDVTQADLVRFEVGVLYNTLAAGANSGGADAYTSVNINSISIKKR